MKSKIQIFIVSLFLVTAFSCSQKSKIAEGVASIAKEATFERIKPILDMAVGCQSDVFEAVAGAQINYASGAKVIVPTNAFVDASGNPVQGKVKLEFSEINDAASVIASGLPMCIEEKGKIGYFESGGMFEIKAKQNGQQLRLADGKQIEIQTMSDKAGSFNFYQYNDTSGKWVEQNQTALSANSQPSAPVDNSVTNFTTNSPLLFVGSEPKKPIKASSEDPVFDLNVDNVDQFGMKNWESIMWKFADHSITQDEKNDWLFSRKWKKIHIAKVDNNSGVCTIIASRLVKEEYLDKKTGEVKKKYVTREKSAQVTPVLFGNGYKEALKSYDKAVVAHKQKQEKAKMAIELSSARRAFVRAVSVRNLGVYNWDRIIKQPETLLLNAKYDVPGKYQDHELPIVYMITGDRGEVITFYQSNLGNLAFNPTYSNTLLAIMPNKEIAILKTDKIPQSQLNKAKSSKNISLHLSPTGVFVHSTQDLSKFIETNS